MPVNTPATLPADDPRRLAHHPRRALFLDLDGTLLEFAPHPDRVQVGEHLVDLLLDLQRALGGAVAVVTGRHLESLAPLGIPPGLAAAGMHGLQWRGEDGVVEAHVPDRRALAAARSALQAFVAKHPGLLLEDKGAGLALHYRGAPDLAVAAERAAREALAQAGEAWHLQAGKMVFELKSDAADKGTAIARFMQLPPFAGREPVFLGDDVTDEDGFTVVNAAGGVSVKVGAGESRASWRLPDTTAVIAWLQEYRDYLVRHAAGE